MKAPCTPHNPHSFGGFAMDWDEIDTVVEFNVRFVVSGRSRLTSWVGLGVTRHHR